jgi:signal transduction histidine kinase
MARRHATELSRESDHSASAVWTTDRLTPGYALCGMTTAQLRRLTLRIVKPLPGAAFAARRALPTARSVWRGLIQLLAARDPAPAWQSPRQRRAAYRGLAVASLALSIVSVASLHGQPVPSALLAGPRLGAGQLALSVVLVAPLPLAVRYPLLGWRIGWLGLLLAPLAHVYWWGGWPWGPAQLLALLVAFCAVGLRHPRSVLWWAWGLSLIPWWRWLGPDIANVKGPIAASVAFTAVTVAVDAMSSRRHVQRDLTAQTERTELERARRAVLEERTRIARELHDVVAHHMSLIAVRAESAPYRLSGLPEPVSEEFRSLSETAREALADMRRLLGALRNDQTADRAPQPQLSDLPMLVGAARLAGVSVELCVPAKLDQVPAGVAVCAYRIVQESLSNASQHAPGAAVTVSVDQSGSAVLLRVANGPGGAGHSSDKGRGRGHGLVGMRERVALLGGSLSAGPAPDGGFVVSAVLPIGAAA